MVVPTFHPEYGRYMLESTPGAPYSGSLKDLISVEPNMRFRRKLAKAHLKPNEHPVTLTSFPRLGVREVFTVPEEWTEADSDASQSLFVGKGVTNPHARFPWVILFRLSLHISRSSLVHYSFPHRSSLYTTHQKHTVP
jgi:glutamate--cysteine ligase catalytic subunit